MKLLKQESDKHWTLASDHVGRAVYVRDHRLTLVSARSDLDLRSIVRLLVRPSATAYGGVAAEFLLFKAFDAEVGEDGQSWQILVTLREATDKWTRPFRVLDTATGEVRDIDTKLYGDPVEFRDVLPTCGPFEVIDAPA